MTKQEEFLWIVQTSLLANAINLASSDRTDEYRHEVSATGMFMNADEAMRASGLIPDRMTAGEAAHDFIFFMCSNLRESDERTGETAKQCPAWFARR